MHHSRLHLRVTEMTHVDPGNLYAHYPGIHPRVSKSQLLIIWVMATAHVSTKGQMTILLWGLRSEIVTPN